MKEQLTEEEQKKKNGRNGRKDFQIKSIKKSPES